MIEQSQVLPLLKTACPSFQTDEDILYAALGNFARHLLELQRSHRIDCFPAVARVIERLHVEGDQFVREAATIGVLEGIQNTWGNSGVDPQLFAAHLLPESHRWWEELSAFWRGERRSVGEGFRQGSA